MEKERYRKGVFIVTYAITKKGVEYLVLKRKLHWKGWEFPKGGVERFELKRSTIKRELKEETGLIPLKIKNFGVKGKYKYNQKFADRKKFIGQTYSLYSAEVEKPKKVTLDKIEHSDLKWLPFDKALKILTWKNQKECLKVVEGWLNHGKN